MGGKNNMTFTQILESEIYKLHHTAWARGYVSRKTDSIVLPYKGRYGEGYKVLQPSFTSTQYCYVTYYVK